MCEKMQKAMCKTTKKVLKIRVFLALLTIVINYIKNSQKNSKKDLKIL